MRGIQARVEIAMAHAAASRKPEVLYVGRAERDELLALAAPDFTEIGEDGNRLEFYGLKVFEVNADNHLQVGGLTHPTTATQEKP
jgi:hypothetical protein